MVATPGPNPSTSHGVYNATPPTVADGQAVPIQVDVNGNVKTVGAGSGGAEPVNLLQAGGTTLNAAATAGGAVPVKGLSAGVSVTLTRPNDTTAYLANDVIGAATGSTAALTFAGMGLAAGGEVMITSASLEIDAAALISGETTYNLQLYSVTPPSALGDNAPWDLPSGDRASFLGTIALGTPVDLGSTLYVATDIINKQITLASGSLFAYLVTVGPYTPTANRVYVIKLHAVVL